MKIVFFCGSLENGKNGVGDYVRRLAGELIRQGHNILAVALNDSHINADFDGMQVDEETLVPVVRITSGTLSKKLDSIKMRINNFDPDWISLQFVPYSFEKRGMPFLFAIQLASIKKEYKWHIMFHELWVGGNAVKPRITSFLQRIAIKEILRKLEPAIIHTHLPTYSKNLSKLYRRIPIKPLPLFSNIPVCPHQQDTQIADSGTFRMGFFSKFDLNVEIILFLKTFIDDVKKAYHKFEIVLIGATEKKAKAVIEILEKNDLSVLAIKYTGFLPAKDVSYFIQQCDLGITSVHEHGLGKSGSVAAFIAHGLPIAAPNIHKDYLDAEIGFFSEELKGSIIKEPSLQYFAQAKIAAFKAAEEIKLSNIANIMVKDLNRQYE